MRQASLPVPSVLYTNRYGFAWSRVRLPLRNKLPIRSQQRHPDYALGQGRSTLLAALVQSWPIALWLLLSACSGPAAAGSIGAVLSRSGPTGAVHVRETPHGLASNEAGILPGDRVKMVDGVLVDELDEAQLRALLRGPLDSKVVLTILRGSEVLEVEIRRGQLAASASLRPQQNLIE